VYDLATLNSRQTGTMKYLHAELLQRLGVVIWSAGTDTLGITELSYRCKGTPMISLLYVDDDPDVQEIALLSLGLDPDLEVRPASTGAEALALLESGWVPDLLMLDMMMPEMDGPATLAAIRTRPHLAEVPAIFITARAGSVAGVSAAELGAIGVISKPFDPLSLAAQVRKFVPA
jgi:CheY-like chemotaxis protein